MNREPKFRGCGIFMPLQPINDLVRGDTCFDADAGPLEWDGEQWITGNVLQTESDFSDI